MKLGQYRIYTAIIKGSSNSMEGLNKDPSEMSVACGGVMSVADDVMESSPLLSTVRGLVFVEDSISVIEFTLLRSKLKVDEFSSPIGKLTLRSVVSPSVSGTMLEVFSWSDTTSLTSVHQKLVHLVSLYQLWHHYPHETLPLGTGRY